METPEANAGVRFGYGAGLAGMRQARSKPIGPSGMTVPAHLEAETRALNDETEKQAKIRATIAAALAKKRG